MGNSPFGHSAGSNKRASLAAIETVAEEGVAALERGDFTLVSGYGGSRELLDRLNQQVARRVIADTPGQG